MKPIRLLALATVIAANLLCALQAETKLPSILGSHMVLQRNTPITPVSYTHLTLPTKA